MIAFSKRSTAAPRGWNHPRLRLHRTWHARRVWQWRARAGVIALVALLVAVFALGWSPYVLLIALVALVLPTPLRAEAALRELEARGAGAYTTALGAPEDAYGLQQRLETQALAWQRQTEAPALPWLEGIVAVALCSLLLVFPPRGSLGSPMARDVPTAGANRDNPNDPQAQGGNNEAPPVLDAPSRSSAPAGDAARPGQAASGGTPGESQIGDVKDGGGRATDDPGEVSREFMDALERGAVRDRTQAQDGRDPNRTNPAQVQDNDAQRAAQQGNAQSGDQNSGQGQNGQGQNGQGNQRNGQRNGNGGQQGNQGQGSSPGQNGQPGQQGQGQQGAGDGQGQQGTQPGSNQGAGNGQQRNGQNGTQRSPDGRGQPGADDGSGDAGNGQNNSNNPANRGQATQGNRGSSDPRAAERPQAGQGGKLEYLPGTVRGTSARSGALQLPGDPRQPLTATPGTPAFRRAAEGAVLDPKLPPEYQELLRNYYR